MAPGLVSAGGPGSWPGVVGALLAPRWETRVGSEGDEGSREAGTGWDACRVWGWKGQGPSGLPAFHWQAEGLEQIRTQGGYRQQGSWSDDRVLSWRAVRTVAAARPRAPEGSRCRGSYQNVWFAREQTLGRSPCAMTSRSCVRVHACVPGAVTRRLCVRVCLCTPACRGSVHLLIQQALLVRVRWAPHCTHR